MSTDLENELSWLEWRGCKPSIYRRGTTWRAHVNQAGNYWADGPDPRSAMAEAVKAWMGAGMPMDGLAAGLDNTKLHDNNINVREQDDE